MTGIPPICPAICSASSFAPPICPESSGITKVPASSATTTGLSLSLSDTNGAIMRTAMPQAPITTMAFFSANCCLVQSDSDNPSFFASSVFVPTKACLIFSASFVPFSVNVMILIFILFPLIFLSYEIPSQNPAHTVWISHNADVPQYLPQ